MWGVTTGTRYYILYTRISTHTPHVGRDYANAPTAIMAMPFQLTRPMWGVTGAALIDSAARNHFNSHAPCGA